MVGLKEVALKIPPVHEYVLAPVAVTVAELPAQSVTETGLTEILGTGFTVTLTRADAVPQPLAPITEYVNDEVGTKGLPFTTPELHV